ncbi:uncharacterized protein LOC128198603 [Bicyclus anynana]|uniref:Uncharacterized protein LOC128198603 n=1 Tax=Bicyclus anynana TaxID=110368 RepID=A0ABM3LP09_BICAN|nr:uncharacterized protein LOC128198603 [Bicyclus anynana]
MSQQPTSFTSCGGCAALGAELRRHSERIRRLEECVFSMGRHAAAIAEIKEERSRPSSPGSEPPAAGATPPATVGPPAAPTAPTPPISLSSPAALTASAAPAAPSSRASPPTLTAHATLTTPVSPPAPVTSGRCHGPRGPEGGKQEDDETEER